jgi:hypothetical protein
MYIRRFILPPFCLCFLSSSRNVLYFYPIQLLLSSSLVPSIPPLCPAQPSLLSLPSLAKPAQPSSCPCPTVSSLDSDSAPCPPLHPQTDGQTERINQTIEAYLRSFINYEMDNWVGLLPMAEFAYNNSVTQATGMSPFYANYGRHPGCTNPSNMPTSDDTQEGYINHLVSVQGLVTRNLKATQERMKRYADLKRKDAPEFKAGDLVMLDGRHIQTRRPKDKLDHKKHGPFAIEKVVSPTAIRLSLPRKWKIHNTFHVSLLEPYNNGT